jgi:hypothetical protein
MTTIVAIALTGLAALSVCQLVRDRRAGAFLFSLAVLAGLALLLRRFFGFPGHGRAGESRTDCSREIRGSTYSSERSTTCALFDAEIDEPGKCRGGDEGRGVNRRGETRHWR